jgi:hypothetical protein
MQGDIKQAAKWMREGKKVRRAAWFAGRRDVVAHSSREDVVYAHSLGAHDVPFSCTDLLAEDWEVADAG